MTFEVVIAEPGRHVWAEGAYRLEVVRNGSRCWRWRVWHVVGGRTCAVDTARAFRDARRHGIARLDEEASR